MKVAELIELLQTFDSEAHVVIASTAEGLDAFYELFDVDGDEKKEAVLWPAPEPLAEDVPPETLTH